MDWRVIRGLITVRRVLTKDINKTLKEVYKDMAAVRAVNPNAEFDISVEGLTIDLEMRDIND